MRNTIHERLSNTNNHTWRPLTLALMLLCASFVIDSSHAQMQPDVKVTKIHQKFVEQGKASVAFTLCSGDEALKLPRITVSSDLQTKNISLRHDLRSNTCLGGTTIIDVNSLSTITASIAPKTNNILHEKTANEPEKLVYHGMSSDGSLKVEITSEKLVPEESLKMNLKFTDTLGNPVKHVNYDIIASQDNRPVLGIKDLHSAQGSDIITTNKLVSDSPITVNIMIHGIGLPGQEDKWTGPKGEVIMFQVVPEFGTVAAMILAVSILSILILCHRFKSFTVMKIQQ